MYDEILDLVDEDDRVIGTIKRSEYQNIIDRKLGYIRAVDMFIVNDKGRLWVPKRTLNKVIAPGGLDFSMGGHVGSGETYIESALREIKEELNLVLMPEDLELLKKFTPSNLPYFRNFYIYRSNQTPDYNRDDFVGADWLTPQEVISKLDNGTAAKSSLRESVELIITTKKLQLNEV